MAIELVEASITKWRPGLLGTAKVDRTDSSSGAFENVSEDQIKLRLFAKWLEDELGKAEKEQDDNKRKELKDKLWQHAKDGYVTVEILERKPVTPPGVSAEEILKSFKELLK